MMAVVRALVCPTAHRDATGLSLRDSKPVDSKRRNIESRSPCGQKVGLQLTERTGELEPMARARAGDEDLQVSRMKIHDEVMIRRISEEANRAL